MSTRAPSAGVKTVLRGFNGHGWFILCICTLVLSFYWWGYRPTNSVSTCHRIGQQVGRARLQQRFQADPENSQLKQALQAGMFFNDDYQTAYRNCMRSRGYGVQP